MFRLVLLVALAGLAFTTLLPENALAQRRSGGNVEAHFYGGYRFTFSRSATIPDPDGGNSFVSGDLDIKDSGFWGVALNFNLRPDSAVELIYNRQDTELTFREFGNNRESKLADTAVEYWHVGGLYGIPQGQILPFTSFSLGATHYVFKNSDLADDWRFSIMAGLGVKYYANERFGLRLQARLPMTFFSGGAGFGCGTGGCGTTIGGTGISQLDFGGGAFIRF